MSHRGWLWRRWSFRRDGVRVGRAVLDHGVLSQIPREFATDLEGNIEIYVADLLAAGEATGRSRPTGSTDADEATEWLGPITGRGDAPVFVPVPFVLLEGVGSLGDYKDEVGFAVTDVDATIEARALPLSMMVLAGELQPAGTTEVAAIWADPYGSHPTTVWCS